MRKSISGVFAVLLLAIGTVPSAERRTIEVVPQSLGAGLGSTFDVDVRVSDLVDGAAPSIGSFDLDVLFDPAILSVAGVTFGSALDLRGFGTINDVDQGSAGRLNAFEVSFDLIADPEHASAVRSRSSPSRPVQARWVRVRLALQ